MIVLNGVRITTANIVALDYFKLEKCIFNDLARLL